MAALVVGHLLAELLTLGDAGLELWNDLLVKLALLELAENSETEVLLNTVLL